MSETDRDTVEKDVVYDEGIMSARMSGLLRQQSLSSRAVHLQFEEHYQGCCAEQAGCDRGNHADQSGGRVCRQCNF